MEGKIGDKDFLLLLVRTQMPFGKYKGRLIADLPENYLVWFKGQGFPKNKLGQLLETAYEIKLNGLDDILVQLKRFET
jgi:uncharacterized protein